MAPRTLASTWKQFQKLTRRYEKDVLEKGDYIDSIDNLSRRANSSGIVEALESLIVQQHSGMEEVGVRFFTSNGDDFPQWVTAYSSEEKQIQLNPLGLLKFQRQCDQALKILKTPVARESFQKYRYHAYLAELKKLPVQCLLFIHLLKEVARISEVALVEKKGGGIEEIEDESYMILLWAFKELEAFFVTNSGVNLRCEYGIRWYESDWIVGK